MVCLRMVHVCGGGMTGNETGRKRKRVDDVKRGHETEEEEKAGGSTAKNSK